MFLDAEFKTKTHFAQWRLPKISLNLVQYKYSKYNIFKHYFVIKLERKPDRIHQ